MQKKRTLKALVSERERQLIYLRNSAICTDFFEEARKEGFHFGKLSRKKWVTDNLISIHSNGEMGHPPYFVRAMLNTACDEIVDYEKYVSGEADFSYAK